MHKNENKQFLKIPKNFERPSSKGGMTGIQWDHRNIYIAYLWVKNYSRFGRVHISHIPKKHFGHWISKLISVGFMHREGEFYVLKSYERVWELLGIQKVTAYGEKCYRFRKLTHYINWSEFKKKTIEDIQGFQTDRKKAQFRTRHRLAGSPMGVEFRPLFSAQASAKLFGYKSRVTGSKYRDRFFDVVKEPLKLRLKYTKDQLPYWQYDCKRIELRTIFHEG